MNDIQIADTIKALEICTCPDQLRCYTCPLIAVKDCRSRLLRDALEAIRTIRPETP